MTAVAIALSAQPASAWTPPGDRPAVSPMVSHFVALAETFWQQRNVPACPAAGLQVDQADDLSDGLPWDHAYGRGELNGCRIWLLSNLITQAQTGSPGNDSATFLCRTITIEIGHTGGLDDNYVAGGVMDPAAAWADGTPWACRAWALDQRRAFRRAAIRFARIVRREQRSAGRRRVVRGVLSQ